MHHKSSLSPVTIEQVKHKAIRVDLCCDFCHEPFSVLKSRIENSARKGKPVRFCSRECKDLGHAQYFDQKRKTYLVAGEKKCTICGETKPLTAFRKGYGHPDTLQSSCQACQGRGHRQRYWRNPDASRAYARVNARNHQEAIKARGKRWYAENRDKQIAWYREYNEKRREQQREYNRQRRASWTPEQRKEKYSQWNQQARDSGRLARWQDANAEKLKSYKKLWLKACHRKNADKENLRRARKLMATIGEVNRGDIINRWGKQCYICDRPLQSSEIHIDHIYPLARGGAHTESNLRPCCQPCNSRKGARTPEELEEIIPDMAKRVKAHLV